MIFFFALLFFMVALAFAGYLFWARKVRLEIAEGAEVEWARLSRVDPDLLEGLDEKGFAAIYERVHFPRMPGYTLSAVATFLLGAPVIHGLLAGVEALLTPAGAVGGPASVVGEFVVEDGVAKLVDDVPPEALQYYVQDISGFFYFFGLLIAWGGIFAWFMARYHRRTPGTLREEIIRAR